LCFAFHNENKIGTLVEMQPRISCFDPAPHALH
jgi:hypothetical protein